MHTSLKNKTTLVTGVSSGIGREIAQLLAERGARVFGTVRNPQSASPIPGVEILRMEVTEDASVNEAVQSIVQKAGPIQFLVNNAGYSFMGALEETSVAEARQQFETNLFGVLRVTNAILPGMRQQGDGRIVNISSVLGFLPAPYLGIYAASKHAVEGYTETLDHEIRRFGVRAVLVEPAYTRTKLSGNTQSAQISIDVYAEERKRLTDAVQQNIERGDDPHMVAEAVWNALTAKSPRLRYPVGKGVALSRLRRFVPAGMFDKSFREQFQLDGHVNTPVAEHPTVNAPQEPPMPQKASEPADAVVADEVSFVKSYRRPLMTIGLLAGGLTVALMAGWSSKPAMKDPRLQSPRVEIFTAKTNGSNNRAFTGIVEARVQSDLGFRVGGKILERSVNMGERVQKGQILMRIDSLDLKLSFAAQQANVEAARAKYTQTRADEARFAALVKSGAVSRQEYDQARAALDSAKAQLDAAEAEARVSNNSSEYAVLLADADGVIVRTLSEPGQVVAAGQTVIQLAHDGPREALINLPEGVRPDLGATASARLYGQDRRYQARLRQLSGAADPVSRTFEARYVLEGEAASAPLGSTVTITLVARQPSGNQLVRVPVGAVYDRGGGPGVWIVDDKSEVKFRLVQIASIGQEEAVVSDGVGAGEKVVALGAHLLHEGQVVSAAKDDKKEEKMSYAKF
jgi:RND family efflux transporter MFP subunit